MQLPTARAATGSNDAEVTTLIHPEGHKPQEGVIYTTLYDLFAALNETVDPEEDYLVTTAVLHLLKTRQVRCTGDLRGYQLVCDSLAQVALPGQKKNDLLSHSKKSSTYFEKSRYRVIDEEGIGNCNHQY
jgi:hypothetical protein